jgi:hypothetical protein
MTDAELGSEVRDVGVSHLLPRIVVDAGSLEQAIELENRTQVLALRAAEAPEAFPAFREGRAPSHRRC